MTKDQAVKNAQTAFIAALDAGVDEDALIEAVFEATSERELKAIKSVGQLVADFWRRKGVKREPQEAAPHGFKLHEFLAALTRNRCSDRNSPKTGESTEVCNDQQAV